MKNLFFMVAFFAATFQLSAQPLTINNTSCLDVFVFLGADTGPSCGTGTSYFSAVHSSGMQISVPSGSTYTYVFNPTNIALFPWDATSAVPGALGFEFVNVAVVSACRYTFPVPMGCVAPRDYTFAVRDNCGGTTTQFEPSLPCVFSTCTGTGTPPCPPVISVDFLQPSGAGSGWNINIY